MVSLALLLLAESTHQVKESSSRLVGERIFPSRGGDEVVCLRVDANQMGERHVEYVNLLYSPKTAFKLLHSLHHLNGASWDQVNCTHYALNPAIVALFDEWARTTANSSTDCYRLHCKTYYLGINSVSLGPLLKVRREGRKRELETEESQRRFIHTREIVVELEHSHRQQALWLFSNGGAYCRVVTVYESGWSMADLMEVVEVSGRLSSSLLSHSLNQFALI